MRKAAIYARVSSDQQEKDGTIESQVAELKRQVAKTGGTLVHEYIDNGYSGYYLDRPAMNQLREDIKTNEFEAVYFLVADRIAREATYQNIIVGELIRNKKQIVIGGKDYHNNPENKLTLTVLGAVSEFERARIIERSMRGRKYWLKQGVLMSNGSQTYGYTYHKRTDTSHPSYTINKQEAEVVRKIFELYAKGDTSFRQIAFHLKKVRAYRRPKSKAWNWSHVHHILKNEMYTGMRYFDTMTDANEEQDPLQKLKARKMMMRDRRDWIGIPVPAVISKELFEKVQAKIEHNEKCYRNAKNKQLLSGLLWCDQCGSPSWSFRQYYWIKRSKQTTKIYEKYLYCCSGRRKVGYCNTMQIDVRPLHICVFEMIQEHMLEPEKLRKCLRAMNKRVNREKFEKELSKFDEQIRATDTKKIRITDLYASGDLNKEEYLKRMAQYDAEAASLRGKKSELQTRVPMVIRPADVEKALAQFCELAKTEFEQVTDTETKRQFLLSFVERVTYRNDRVTVHGFISVDGSKIEFVFKRTIDREKLLEETLQHDRKVGRIGSPVRRDFFGKLLAEAKVVSPKV